MDGQGGPNNSNWSLVPLWDGKPESFSHFIHEVKWSYSSCKKEDRALLGAKIIRKALQSGQPALVQLMYKLDPEDFTTQDSAQKLLRYLESSPLNRQALPDAGNKIGGYYRRLRKRPNETIPSFLIREDKVHDEMIRALQRLLREKELDFDGYEVTLSELRDFCGMKEGASLYFGPEEDFDDGGQTSASEAEASTHSQRTPTPRKQGVPLSSSAPRSHEPSKSSTSAASTADPPAPKGKDLVQRLMEKGLIPLAALDVIRGWMLLEMSTMTDEDRRIVRAATRNKLGYTDIRAALLSMFEEKAHRIPLDHDFRGPKGKGKKGSAYAMEQDDPGDSYYENSEWDDSRSWTGDHETMDYVGDNGWWDASNWHQDAWWQSPDWNEGGVESWPAEESTGQTSDQDETVAHLLKEQEEAERSMSELQALMAENTRNLVEARRAVAAAAKDRGWNQPPQQRQPKPTSSYKGFKGSSKNKGKVNYYEDASWMKGKGQPFQKGGFGKNYNYGKGKGNSNKGFSKSINYVGSGLDYEFYPLDESVFAEDPEPLGEAESIIDTGATASAGGQWAVQALCKTVMRELPEATMQVFTSDRPWFRYGNGKWGQALYKVVLKHQGIELPIFSLPSPGVPVLTGMRELMKLDALLGCKGGKCLINGFQRELKVTKKRHLLIDYVQDIFKPPMMQQGGNSSGSAPTSAMNARPKQATDRIWVDNSGHSRTNRLTQFSNNTNFCRSA